MLAESNAMRIAAEELRAKICRIEMEEAGNRPNPSKVQIVKRNPIKRRRA
jgi:hypothetical protein